MSVNGVVEIGVSREALRAGRRGNGTDLTGREVHQRRDVGTHETGSCHTATTTDKTPLSFSEV